MNNKLKIQTLIFDLISRKGYEQTVSDDESLISSGYLDSVDVIDIVVFLEQEFNLDFADRGIDQSEFDSIDSILQLIDDMSQ